MEGTEEEISVFMSWNVPMFSAVATVHDSGDFLLVYFLLKDPISVPANSTLGQLGKEGLFLPCHMSLK